MQTPHDLALAVRDALLLCSFALDEAAATRRKGMLDLRRTLTAPLLHWKLFVARKHRTAAKRCIESLHDALHDRASLGVHNADLWSAITRAVDAIALSRWLNAKQLAPEDIAHGRTTVRILMTELAGLLGLLHELAWPAEMPGQRG